MKLLLYTIGLSFIASQAMSQAITLSSSPGVNVSKLDSCGIPTSLSALPSISPATNASWDFSATAVQTTPFTYQYRSKTSGFSTASFSDSTTYSLSAASGIGFKVWRNLSQGSTAVTTLGEEVLTRQAKGLGTVTGNTLDSFIIPTQVIAFSTPLPILKFPATMSSAWSATTARVVNFNVTASIFSLNNAPGQQRQMRSYLDSVVGWGRMKVPVMGKTTSSSWIPVLQVRHRDVAVDSFYLNGAPASATILAALNLMQGQRTVTTSTYFYRASAFRPLFEGLHLDSNFSSSLSKVYLHATDLPEGATGISIVPASTVHVYPNPLHGRILHIDMPDDKTSAGLGYALINVAGQEVASGNLAVDAAVHAALLSLPQNLSAGIYYLKLQRESLEPVIVPLELQ